MCRILKYEWINFIKLESLNEMLVILVKYYGSLKKCLDVVKKFVGFVG